MMSMENAEYLPSEMELESVHRIRDYLLSFVESTLHEQKIEGKVMAVGSTAKDTFVRGDTDIDIFIVSPKFKEAYEVFKRKLPEGRRKIGAMDIWHFIHEGYDVDLVFIPPDHPRIDTLIHTAFMNKNLTPKQKQEVIRAKAFFKSEGVYGAEIGGIVGIAVEELIRRYNTLENICEILLSSKEPPFIQDPATPKRTLLASLKPVRWRQLQTACDTFLKRKSFKLKPYTKKHYFQHRETWEHLSFTKNQNPLRTHNYEKRSRSIPNRPSIHI